jgi:hypothetical protein
MGLQRFLCCKLIVSQSTWLENCSQNMQGEQSKHGILDQQNILWKNINFSPSFQLLVKKPQQ